MRTSHQQLVIAAQVKWLVADARQVRTGRQVQGRGRWRRSDQLIQTPPYSLVVSAAQVQRLPNGLLDQCPIVLPVETEHLHKLANGIMVVEPMLQAVQQPLVDRRPL